MGEGVRQWLFQASIDIARVCYFQFVLYAIFNPFLFPEYRELGGIGNKVVARWTAGQQLERSILHHNEIHLYSRLSSAQHLIPYSAES